MTYGPQPGWNPNQPPVGPQPGYPAQPPGYQVQQPGYPAGQPGPYSAPATPRSPLVVITGAIAMVLFAYLVYDVIIDLVVTANGNGNLAYHTSFLNDVAVAVRHTFNLGRGLRDGIGGVIAILWLAGGLLLFLRKPAGRILTALAGVIVVALGIVALVSVPSWYASLFMYVVPVIALIALVLVLLPATGAALRRGTRRTQPAGYGPPSYQQQPQFAPQPQPGSPQQPPGGYQPPPGMPR